jgi:hypothetical protein
MHICVSAVAFIGPGPVVERLCFVSVIELVCASEAKYKITPNKIKIKKGLFITPAPYLLSLTINQPSINCILSLIIKKCKIS